MTTDDAKSYLAKREVPQLFECLLTGLMYHRPKEHVDYLIDCLSKIKQQGLDHVRWNLFIEQRRKTPLPPVTPPNGRHSSRPGSRRSAKNFSREGSRDIPRSSPLPPIGGLEKACEDQLDIQNVPVIFMMGGPGSGKGTHCKRLVERYSSWVHLSMGDLIRDQIGKRGSSEEKWNMVTDLLQKGEMAPEDVTIELLTANMKKHQKAAGFIIEGYPRTLQQVNEYEAKVGHVDMVFLLDCEEYYLQSRLLLRGESQQRMDDNLNAITARIAKFKNLTLPVVKHYDDRGQLVILDGDRDAEEIYFDICSVFDSSFFQSDAQQQKAPHPPSKPKSPTQRPRSRPASRGGSPNEYDIAAVTFIPDITVDAVDQGRNLGLPQCPIVFVMGGPGSGRNTQCKKIAENNEGFVHLAMGDILRHQIAEHGSADDKWAMAGQLVQKGELAPHEMTSLLLVERISASADAKCIIIESFPKSETEIAEFNKLIGGMNLAVILDVHEITMIKRLLERGHRNDRGDDNINAIKHRIKNFKENTLPLIKYYDDVGQLAILDGEKDVDAVYADLENELKSLVNEAAAKANLSVRSDPANQGLGVGLGIDDEVDADERVEQEDDGGNDDGDEVQSEAVETVANDNELSLETEHVEQNITESQKADEEVQEEQTSENVEVKVAEEQTEKAEKKEIEATGGREETAQVEQTVEDEGGDETPATTEEAVQETEGIDESQILQEVEANEFVVNEVEAEEVEATAEDAAVVNEGEGGAGEDIDVSATQGGEGTAQIEEGATENGDGATQGEEELTDEGVGATQGQEGTTGGGATENEEDATQGEDVEASQVEEEVTDGGDVDTQGGEEAGSGQENNQTDEGQVEDTIVPEHFEPLGEEQG